MADATSALAEQAEQVRLIDHHVHGCWTASGERRRFEDALNEANTEPIADFDSGFDSQLGFAVRAHCAPLLDLPRHADPESYWQRRAQFSEQELARLFLPAAGVSDWLVDTGLSDGVTGLEGMARHSGGQVHEVVRLEQVAEQAADASGDYVTAFDEFLARRTAQAVGTKSILAYRGGLAGDLSDPTAAEVHDAAERWRAQGGRRLTDRVLLRFGVHRALRLGLPLQFHVGLGDRECDLEKTNPLHLLDLLRHNTASPVVLLHCYPYEREAGYLAQAFSNVYVDVGLAVNHLGARSTAFLRRILELAPLRKILYSSDGYGPAELHFLGARLWRNGIREALQQFVDSDEWSAQDAIRVMDLIANRNAERLYRLGSAARG